MDSRFARSRHALPDCGARRVRRGRSVTVEVLILILIKGRRQPLDVANQHARQEKAMYMRNARPELSESGPRRNHCAEVEQKSFLMVDETDCVRTRLLMLCWLTEVAI